jgi:hypothetical protein
MSHGDGSNEAAKKRRRGAPPVKGSATNAANDPSNMGMARLPGSVRSFGTVVGGVTESEHLVPELARGTVEKAHGQVG